MEQPDQVVTISGILRAAGPVSLVAVVGLLATLVLLAAGLRARARTTGTERVHWWLQRLTWVLFLSGVLAHGWRQAWYFSDTIDRHNQGFGRGLDMAMLMGVYEGLPSLIVPVAVALVTVLASMVLGAPRPAPDRG